MERETSLSWPDITTPGEDEFSNFLEFGMHFPDLESHGPIDHHPPPPRSLAVSMPASTAPAQDQLMHLGSGGVTAQSPPFNRMMAEYPMDLSHHPSSQAPVSSPAFSHPPVTPAFYTQKQPQQHAFTNQPPQQGEQQQPHPQLHPAVPTSHAYVPHSQHVIPPTPNSIELQGNAATYPQQVDENHGVYDRYTRVNDEQALYTPLVSPAMTPLETQFRLPEYTIPGEYFTPLTSPALEAQNANTNAYPVHSGQVSEMGFVSSPADTIPTSSAPSSPALVRQQQHHRRRQSATKPFHARAKKQQSPSVRPQARKKSQLHHNSDDILNGLNHEQAKSRNLGSSSALRHGSTESSGQDSVSPEPLSEPLMPPPALPSARKSPVITPQASQSQTSEPATPAMLMRIQRAQQNSTSSPQTTPQSRGLVAPVSTELHDDIMEDVVLPEAATPTTHLTRPSISRIDTSIRTDAASSNTSASNTPALEPKLTPGDRSAGSLAPSPRSMAMPSPSGPVAKKSDTPKLGPMVRKRQSLSSSQASPNLRPKISPSIQPLVRGDGVSGETSALYLASKSNYQHILDGTLLPGVSYPETLAENLSSKRTNHKLAEQGRRNRINHALKEIEVLIPPAFVQLKNAKEAAACNAKGIDKEKEKSNPQISKASTVEMAIDYIKALKQELDITKNKLAAAESRLGDQATATQDLTENTTSPENGPGQQDASTTSK